MSITGQTPDGKKRQVDTEFAVKHPSNWATPVETPAGGTAEGFLDRKRKANAEGKSMGVSLTDLSMQVAEWQKPRMVPTRKGDQMRQETSQEYWERMETRPDLEGQKGEPWPTPQEHDKTTGNADRVGRFGTAAGGRNLTDEVVHPTNWSTPRTIIGDYTRDGGAKGKERLSLDGEAKSWTTPQEDDANNATRNSGQQRSLTREVVGEPWATPIDSDYKGSVTLEHAESRALVSSRGTRLPEQVTLVERDTERKFQRLNPNWEELLLSWAVGWTDPTQPCAGIFPGFPAGQGPFQYDYEPPRTIHRDDCPNRTKRVSAIGNGVVTLCAAEAFYLLLTEPIR